MICFRLQVEVYNQCKNALKEGEALIYVDYTESYKKQQDEIQSAYFANHHLAFYNGCLPS